MSYSHADVRWTSWLHRQLERYAIPSKLVGKPSPHGPIPRHLRPVFRDREELSAATDLGDRLRAALQSAAYLLVICSRRSARSQWVEEEIRQYKSYHGEDRILAVIVDGEPYASNKPETAADECFPRALRYRLNPDGTIGDVPTEPIAADLRPVGDGKRLALLKLISGILHVNLDQLVQRDARRRQQQLIAIATAATILSGVFAGLAVMATRARDEAVAQRAQAEGLVEFMIGDLRKRLAPSGRLDALDAVGERALAYYKIQATHGLDASALGRRSRVLHMLGEIQDRRGRLSVAMQQFEQAARSTKELLQRSPNDPQRIFDHAQSAYWVAYVAYRRGQDEVALREFKTYLELAERLYRMDPSKEDWQAEVDYASSSVGTVLLENSRVEEAQRAFRRAFALSSRLAQSDPGDRDRQVDLAQSYAWLADAAYLSGRLDSALSLREQEARIYARLLTSDPSDAAATNALALNRNAEGRIFLASNRLSSAVRSFRAAEGLAEGLVNDAPEDVTYKRSLVTIALSLSQAHLQTGNPKEALDAADEAEALVELLVRNDPILAGWGEEQSAAARVLRARARARTARTTMERAAALAPVVVEAERMRTLSDARPTNLAIVRRAAEAALLAGDHFSLVGDLRSAQRWWETGLAIVGRVNLASLPDYERAVKLRRELASRSGPLTVAAQQRPAPVTYSW